MSEKKFDRADYLKLLEEEKRRKKEEDNQKVDGKTLEEVKSLIRSIVKDEILFGDLPLLNVKRKKKLGKWLSASVIVLLLGGLSYQTFWYESDFLLEINRDKLFVKKVKGWSTERKEIKVLSGKWKICPIDEKKGDCSPIFTPFEARYNKYYKFIFVGRGNVFWVKNDKTQVSIVKLIDGSWSFKNDEDEWTDFDSLNDYQDNESVE